MASSIFGLYNAQRALLVNQAAINIINNNIANMNTEGYSKQRIETSALVVNQQNIYIPENAVLSSGGVVIDQVTRNRDSFYDKYYRDENSDYSYYEEMETNALSIENAVNELNDTGITDAFDGFYTAAQQLSLNPTDSVARTSFVESAITVATRFNDISDHLTDLRSQLVGDSAGDIEDTKLYLNCDLLNEKLDDVAQLNESIILSSVQGYAPNSLLDSRDKLLDEISQYIPITVVNNDNSNISIKLGSIDLVRGAEHTGYLNAVQNPSSDPDVVAADPAIVKIQTSSGVDIVSDAKSHLTTGKLAAILEMGGSDSGKLTINNMLTELNKLAQSFAKEVNAIQTYTEDDGLGNITVGSMSLDTGNNPPTLELATSPMFLDQDDELLLDENSITAANIRVNPEIADDPFKVATARGETDPADRTQPLNPTYTGDNSNILLVAQLRDESVTSLNGATTEAFVTALIGNLGVKSESIQNNFETKGSILDQVKANRESKIGVNLDEELVDLVKYQRAYEASAKIFNVTNEILQKIISLAG